MNRFFSFFIFFCSFSALESQSLARNGILLDINYSYGFPIGDLKERFGNHLVVGAGLCYQPKSHFGQTGIKFSYLFGSKVKEDVVKPFRSSFEGLLLGSDFAMAEIKLRESGFSGQIFTGGIIPLKSENSRNGIKLQLGIGFLQHKIRILDEARAITQFNSVYNKGLDRLTNGIAIFPFIGYEYLQHRGLLSFYAGIEPIFGFTSSKRSYNYDTNSSEYKIQRFDAAINFKIGWYIPFYFNQNSEEIRY